MQLSISTLLAIVLASGNVQATVNPEVRTLSNYIQTVNPKVEDTKAVSIAHAIVIESQESDISVELITAIIEVESTFKVNAVSKEGAVGLMQVHRKSHPKKATKDIRGNVKSGVSILKDRIANTGTLKKALTQYSGGSKGYSKKVLKYVDKYKNYKRKV